LCVRRRVEVCAGVETLSQPFACELRLICDTPQLPLKSMLGQQVSIEIELADAAPRFINGYLTSSEAAAKALLKRLAN
jgi:type VI secretion system secreted protein VgrG